MRDEYKTKPQLIAELEEIRRRAASLEASEADRKRTEEALRESEERFRLLLEYVPDGVYLNDMRGIFIDGNRAAERITGYNREELIGKSILEAGLLVPSDVPIAIKNLEASVAGRPTGPDEFTLKRKDGSSVNVEISTFPLRIGSQELVLGLARDVSERKRAENSLRQGERLRAEAEKLAATGRMAARVAHEINNPLAGIMNCFQLVKAAVPKDHRYYPFAEMIEKEVERVGRIVHQLFEFSQTRKEEPSEVDLARTLAEVIAMLEPSLREREVHVETHLDAADAMVELREDALRQVLYNLIQNAVEASPPGEKVEVRVSRSSQGVQISVSDRGEGIPDEVRGEVFEPFFTTKGDASSGGLGLGLSISKGIVDTLNGSLVFESAPNRGTVFRVVLPTVDA